MEVKFFFKLCHFIPFLSLLLDCCTDMVPFIQCTTESRYFGYYVLSLEKMIDNSRYVKGKVISRSFKFRIAYIMPSLTFLSVEWID